jgi:hypothetical protein
LVLAGGVYFVIKKQKKWKKTFLWPQVG